MSSIRVLVVEDSLTVRQYLVDVIKRDPELRVVGEAEDGGRAIELCKSLCPDVISLDMMLPVMSGLAVTEYVMAFCPTPILIVSASTNRGELFRTYDALSAGAVDVMEKPTAGADSRWNESFRKTIKVVSRIKVITHPRARLAAAIERPELPVGKSLPYRCVVMGASTGGPGAVAEILGALPPGFPLPILVVIHIGAPFGSGLTEWLDSLSPIRVMTAVHGQPLPQAGDSRVILAPPDRHLVIRNGRIWTTTDPERHYCRPSADVLFESVARELGASSIACLLTGMGRDGARGLLEVRAAGGMTIAQDENSSVVFGMPREAISLNAARAVVPLEEVAPMLVAITRSPKGQCS